MRKIRLGDLCEPSGGQLKLDKNTLIDYFDISSVDNESKTTTGFTTYSFGEAPSRARKAIKRNSILVSTVRPNLNAVALFEEETDNIPVASTGFCILDCKQGVNPRFVFNFCRSQKFIDDMTSQATGASYPAVSDKIVRNAALPDYSEREQAKISDSLDRAAKLIKLRKQELQMLDELIKARFVEMFGDPLINSHGLDTKPMTEVCEIIDGDRGKNYPTAEEFSSEGYCLFLNAKNVTASGFSFNNCLFISKEKDEALRKGNLSRGDIVLTTRGTLGNLAFYTEEIPFEHVRINSGMVILRMKREIVDEVYFIEQFKMQLDDIKTKIASGSAQPQLPISTMNKIQVPIPDIEVQNQFAAFVRQVNKSKAVVQAALDKAQLLFASLMQEYFG